MEDSPLHSVISEFIDSLDAVADAGLDIKGLQVSSLLCLLRVSLQRARLQSSYKQLLCTLAQGLPKTTSTRVLTTYSKTVEIASELVDQLDRFISSAAIDREPNIDHAIEEARNIRRRIGAVFVVDCISLVEFSALKIEASRRGLQTRLLDSFFINPLGKTIFVKEQAPFPHFLRNYAQKLASAVEAKHCSQVSFDLDQHLHGDSGFALLDFIQQHPLAKIWEKVLRLKIDFDSVLLTTDHGYDILESNGTLYVVHGSRGKGLLSMSRLAAFLVIW